MSKSQLSQIEEQMVQAWAKENTFQKSLDLREGKPNFEFYDGPPFANGLPHYGHVVSSIVKDAIPRYKTMKGFRVPRRFGWDCHGLPAEMKVEQDLDLGSKAAIEEYGVEKFVEQCRSSVTEFTKEWEFYINRIGRWVDFEDNYYTMDQNYMDSVMWAFKKLYDDGLVSEGFKVMPYCHVCETPLSHFEARQDDSYRDRVDLAVTVRFPLETGETLLAWTTTPWTLPANLALAVNKDLTYQVLEGNGERVVVAKAAVERFEELQGYKKVETKKGSVFVGKKYTPPFDYFLGHKNSHVVLHADFVDPEEGTGIAHEAPGFGEEDQAVTEAAGIEIVVPVDKQGNYTQEITEFAGMNVFDANEHVINSLKSKELLFKLEQYKHTYPHCWRTDNPLIYRAVTSWVIDVPSFKDKLLKANQQINWIPENVKDGAFGKWLEGARPWNVSRDRYWGAPIPVWKTEDGEILVVGSIEEMKKRAVNPEEVTDLHKPAIDKVILKTDSGKEAKRVSDVFDCWFESGAMPFAQHHYPFEGEDKFRHPADFIVEYIGQTRGWFYTLHVLAVALFGEPAFKNVISHGVILGEDNRKMSKRLGNYPDLQHVFDTYGADALRFYMFESPVIAGETVAIDEKAIIDVQRNIFMTLLNSYRFFKTYTDVDKWKHPSKIAESKPQHVLDKWVLSRLNETIQEVEKNAEAYNLPKAVRPIRLFVDDLSNWYIRRSRRRFWKSANDEDKLQAYETLWYVLVRLMQVLAPWAPFLSDHLYRELTGGDSVHLTDWPKPGKVNRKLLQEMQQAREYITEGLSQRAEAGYKVRQPLAKLEVPEISDQYTDIIAEEVNVKEVVMGSKGVKLDTKLTEELELEGISREIVRQVQSSRRKAELNVEDRIKLSLTTDDSKLKATVKAHKSTISEETLAEELVEDKTFTHEFDGEVNKASIRISLEKK